MTYTPFHADWKDFPDITTPITAAALDYIEAGIQAAGGGSVTIGYFNVVDFGAVGDGMTDDTLAFQAAVDAASAAATASGTKARATVLVPGPNTYLLTYSQTMYINPGLCPLCYSCAILMRSNVEIVGIGRPRLFANQIGEHIPGQVAKAIIGYHEGDLIDNWAVRNLVLDGGFVSDQEAPGIAFPDSSEDFFGVHVPITSNYEITGNYFTGIWGDGVRVGDNSNSDGIIDSNYFTLFNGQAAQLLSADRGTIRNNLIFDAQAAAGGASEALNVGQGGGKVSIIGNVVVNCGCIGALGDETMVVGNYVAPNNGGSAAIEIGNSTGVTVSGNVCNLATYGADLTASTKGIFANGSHDITITDNIVLLSGGAMNANAGGIALAGDGTNATVSNNVISAAAAVTQVAARDIFSSDAGCTIIGNDCTACPTSIEVEGANSFVSGNNCSGFMGVGAAADIDQHIVVTGNRVFRTISIASSHNVITDNYIDASTSTNDDGETAFWFGVPDSNSNVIRNNTILGASGINVQGYRTGGSPYGLLDTFDNNLLLGGGVFNLGPTQTFRRAAGSVTTLAYSTTIATDANLGELFTIAATDTSAYTISNPTSACAGMKITYDIKNSSGGSMGTITWGNKFLLAGSFTNPANTKRRTIEFYYDGTNWVETNRAAADI